MDFHFASAYERVADTVPDVDALVQGDRRWTYRRFDEDSARIASAFEAAGVTRGSQVSLYLYNCPEYLLAHQAAFKHGCGPVNVNYRYLDEELVYLVDNSDSEALVFHSSLGDRVARVRDRLDRVRLFVVVRDDDTPCEFAVDFDELLATHEPQPRRTPDPDDVYMLYTGGTTGMPKGVMYRNGVFCGGLYLAVAVALPGIDAPRSVDDVPRFVEECRAAGPMVSIPCCPLMHGTGHVGGGHARAAHRRHGGAARGTILRRRRAPGRGRARAGDPPGHRRRRLRPSDPAGAGGRRGTGHGARRVVAAHDELVGSDVERGGQGRPGPVHRRHPGRRARLQRGRRLRAGDGGPVGCVGDHGPLHAGARHPAPRTSTTGPCPPTPPSPACWPAGPGAFGYYKDPEKTARTFKVIDGAQYVITGDWATRNEDGTITLHGRGSNCINSGGEKIFPEEVEEALKTHPAVDDCLVVGVPDERFGQRVVAIVGCSRSTPTEDELRAHVRDQLAHYKAPRQCIVLEHVQRAPNGKADYGWAREIAATAAEVATNS